MTKVNCIYDIRVQKKKKRCSPKGLSYNKMQQIYVKRKGRMEFETGKQQ